MSRKIIPIQEWEEAAEDSLHKSLERRDIKGDRKYLYILIFMVIVAFALEAVLNIVDIK